jgi:hypothetical protein
MTDLQHQHVRAGRGRGRGRHVSASFVNIRTRCIIEKKIRKKVKERWRHSNNHIVRASLNAFKS